jgi:hypothetical protein
MIARLTGVAGSKEKRAWTKGTTRAKEDVSMEETSPPRYHRAAGGQPPFCDAFHVRWSIAER